MRYIFTCGGTAGHINPALAVASHLRDQEPSSEFLFIGVNGKMENVLVPNAGFDIITLNMSNVARGFSVKNIIHNIITLFNVIFSFFKSLRVIKSFKPDVVIGTGGYVCYPVILAAHFLKIPTVVHESNAFPGMTTRRLEKYADRILLGVKDSASFYKDKTKTVYTGTPVREEFRQYTQKSSRELLGYSQNEKIVLSFMGSLGAQLMNDTIIDVISMMKPGEFKLIHATGERYFDDFIVKLKELVPDYENKGATILKYITDMDKQMIASNLVICRGGASTLSELAFIGRPAIIIPSPNVTDNHQEKNARALEKAGGVKVIIEKDLTADRLYDSILSFISDDMLLKRCSQNMRTSAHFDAVKNCCEEIKYVSQK